MTVGQKIRKIRLEKSLSQKELAQMCKLSEPAIRNYELGNRKPSQRQLTNIAIALNVDPMALEPDVCLFLAVALDVDKDIEIDIIGDKYSVFEVISHTYTLNEFSETDQPDLKITIRKYGSLLFDLELLQKDNVILQYISMQTEYVRKHCDSTNSDVSKWIESFTAPFRTEKADHLINCFNVYRKDYYKIYGAVFMESKEYGLSSENTRFWTTLSGDIGFIATDYDLCTLYKAYINDCARNHKILKRCKLCNSVMLGNIHNIGELCSDECRQKSRETALQRFKNKLNGSEHEAAYHSLYRKLIYQKNKLIVIGVSDTDMFSFDSEFKTFQTEMAKRRKSGIVENDNDFSYWLQEWEEKLMKIIKDISKRGA